MSLQSRVKRAVDSYVVEAMGISRRKFISQNSAFAFLQLAESVKNAELLLVRMGKASPLWKKVMASYGLTPLLNSKRAPRNAAAGPGVLSWRRNPGSPRMGGRSLKELTLPGYGDVGDVFSRYPYHPSEVQVVVEIRSYWPTKIAIAHAINGTSSRVENPLRTPVIELKLRRYYGLRPPNPRYESDLVVPGQPDVFGIAKLVSDCRLPRDSWKFAPPLGCLDREYEDPEDPYYDTCYLSWHLRTLREALD